MDRIRKYPRTPHLESSRLQKGDEDLTQVPFSDLDGLRLVVEEKMDGANAAVSFDVNGSMLLQSRGHYLTGGPREKHWTLFKQWAAVHDDALFDILGNRYVMYGEWLFAKHTVFYDLLPHFFLEFDVYDKEQDVYLSTAARRSLLGSSPVRSVLVLYDGQIDDLGALQGLVTRSYFKSGLWRQALCKQAQHADVDPGLALKQTDASDEMEGLYIKVEDAHAVRQRLKWVRPSFSNSIADSETHWLDRPIIQNILAPSTDIFRR